MNRSECRDRLTKFIATQPTAGGRFMSLKSVNQRQQIAASAATVTVDAFRHVAQVDGQCAIGTVGAGLVEDARQAKFAGRAIRRILAEVGKNLFGGGLLDERIDVR